MRGKVTHHRFQLPHHGITPAYAGKSSAGCFLHRSRKDHPRLCGEKGEKVGDAIGGAGSPPPMRGKGHAGALAHAGVGITPAYAGKSLFCLYRLRYNGDHPRLCGEKLNLDSPLLNSTGSPPPMRGKAVNVADVVNWFGITPAYAGKSRPVRIRLHRWRDHPRLCGEKRFFFDCTCVSMGSPPPMRGKAICRWCTHASMRDHPRLCGEKCSNENRRRIMIGSPPPMRGKVHCFAVPRVDVEDHPRLCGEKRTRFRKI